MIVDEGARTGGFTSEIAARIVDEAFDALDAPMQRVAAEDAPIPFCRTLEAEAIPQPAILAIGRIAPRAVERQGALSLAPTVFLTLAVDHRVLDGAEAAAFLGDPKIQIERGQI